LEEGNEHASPKNNVLSNSPKRSKLDHKTVETRTHQRVVNTSESENINVDNIVDQIIIESNAPSLSFNEIPYNRLKYINSQKNKRYSSSKRPLYLVHVEPTNGNIGNFHLMSLGKALAELFPSITNIKRRNLERLDRHQF